jgi:hypothetical protein
MGIFLRLKDGPASCSHQNSALHSLCRMAQLPTLLTSGKLRRRESDVNLGVHLVRDAFKGSFDEAAILTNDTDLVEPLRIVTKEVGLPVTLLTPVAKPAPSLVNVSIAVRHIAPYLGPCQFPNPVLSSGNKPISKPAGW